MEKNMLFIASSFLLASSNVYSMVISPTDNGTLLASTISGTSISIDNASINYIGTANQGGIFSDGLASGIGIESGILLTSGNAMLASGPNSLSNSGENLGTAGNMSLANLIGDSNIFDANVLSFDFTTTTGDLFFNYVFASEEYNEFLAFSDPFGLFIDGVNYALAPDGQAVSVGTINCTDTGLDPTGPNCSSFNNNENGYYNLEYDGFTDVFTASIQGLSIGSHTMTFAIADVGDGDFDSAVFIEAGSFSGSLTTQVSEPSSLAIISIAVLGLGTWRRRQNKMTDEERQQLGELLNAIN